MNLLPQWAILGLLLSAVVGTPRADAQINYSEESAEFLAALFAKENGGAPADFSMLLSEGRAAAVGAYLIDQGIAENRFTPIGYGDTQPIVPNDTPENQAKNRRIEILY